jgi:predicted amidohydrolase
MSDGAPSAAARSLRVAAVQLTSRLGRTDENLAHATTLAEAAAAQGADLVLLPELMPSGYLGQTRGCLPAMSAARYDRSEGGRP